MSKKAAGIFIRDIEKGLFKYLFLNKVATSKQIARDVYPNITHQALFKRLNQLIDLNLIEANYFKELGGRLVYHVTDKALNLYVLEPNLKTKGVKLKSECVLHDLGLADISAALLKKSLVKNYFSENQLRCDLDVTKPDGINFDALIEIQRNNNTHLLGLEYERSLKFSSRYLTYFKRLYALSNIEAVLYICSNGQIQSAVQAIEEKIITNHWPKVFYSTLSEVLNANEPLAFSNLRKEKIVLT